MRRRRLSLASRGGLAGLLLAVATALAADVERHVLQDRHLRYEFTPQIGGRGLAFCVPGMPNLLRVGEAILDAPDPVVSAFGENRPYLGHIVWIGPQRDWWQDQSLNVDRREAGAAWPPDPWTVLARYELSALDDRSARLWAAASPVTGLEIEKTFGLDRGALRHAVTATNRRSVPVRWDIWFNTRVAAQAQVYVPLSDATTDVMLESFLDGAASADAEKEALGFFDFSRSGPVRAKAFIQPAAGWLAAFSAGQLFVIEFEHRPRHAIHPAHGQVELYLDQDPATPGAGLLELEVHAPWRKLEPGETMTAGEVWRAWPSEAKGIAGQLAELRARGYLSPPVSGSPVTRRPVPARSPSP